MIAIESFKKFRWQDFVIIIVMAFLYAIISYLINKYINLGYAYILSLLALIFLMSFIVHLVRKAGSATLFFVISGLVSNGIDDIGIVGVNKLIVFVVAGIVFELIFLIFKIEIKNVQIDIISGSGFSAAIIPITTGALLSYNAMMNTISSMINMVLLSFFVGIISAVVSFLVWYHLKGTKLVLRYEYMQ